MQRFLLRRLLFGALALLGATILVFSLSRVLGDPRDLYLSQGVFNQTQYDALGKKLGLDKPLVAQYGIWLSRVVRGDLGRSVRHGRKVSEMIRDRIFNTLQLGLSAWLFALLVGVSLGVLSAVNRGTVLDYVGRTIALLGQASPPFWTGIMLILFFSARLEWLPSGLKGDGFAISNFILPTITLGGFFAASNLRIVRSAMLEVLDSEYIKLARAKGVSRRKVIWKHAFKNALIPPLTLMGVQMGSLITGSVVTESVFAWPGLGRLAIFSVNQNDFPVLLGIVLMFTFIFVSVNLVVDVLYAFIDPRIRYT